MLIPLVAWAQTTSWKLIWSPNPEPNMWYYEVYRDTVPDPVTRLSTVVHPETVFVDSSIQKGVRYYYRLRAVDSSYSKSEFSQTVSAAIPRIINLPEHLQVRPDTTLNFDLDNLVMDPDDAPSQLVWQVSGQERLNVQLDAARRQLRIQVPVDWQGSEQLWFTVTDPTGFYDRRGVTITTSAQPPPPAGKINVYPIPFVIGTYGTASGITFENLPLNGTLSIYNLLGELIYKTPILEREFHWKVQNKNGRSVRSGLYVYVIRDAEGRKIHSAKLVIVR